MGIASANNACARETTSASVVDREVEVCFFEAHMSGKNVFGPMRAPEGTRRALGIVGLAGEVGINPQLKLELVGRIATVTAKMEVRCAVEIAHQAMQFLVVINRPFRNVTCKIANRPLNVRAAEPREPQILHKDGARRPSKLTLDIVVVVIMFVIIIIIIVVVCWSQLKYNSYIKRAEYPYTPPNK